MVETGTVVIESPVGADIIVDGRKVGSVGAPVSETGKLSITTVPTGARIYTKRLGDWVYGGLAPQTVTLPASPVPILVKITKPEFSEVYDMVYIPQKGIATKRYAMYRVAIEEPEETTTSLKVMSHPSGEVYLYMEGAEGFISYGKTPQMLTLKARTGAWVPMQEARRALSETRLSQKEQARVSTEDARRSELVRAIQIEYDDAKAERKDVEESLRGFRESYNLFQVAFNAFFSEYSAFITAYSGLRTSLISVQREIAELESLESLEEYEKLYLADLKSYIAVLKSQIAHFKPLKAVLDVEKEQWDLDKRYWTDIILEYEQRRAQCREYEEKMENELTEALLKARAPFWLPTPGMKGVMWHLKLEEKGYRTEVDEFLLEPGRPITKDYALVRILDVTTPESLAPLIINTPRPRPPDRPFAFAWLYIISWPLKIVANVRDNTINRTICHSDSYRCSYKFIQVSPGRRSYTFSGHTSYMRPITMTLDIAAGETRYVQIDGVTPTEAEKRSMGDWLQCTSAGAPSGAGAGWLKIQ